MFKREIPSNRSEDLPNYILKVVRYASPISMEELKDNFTPKHFYQAEVENAAEKLLLDGRLECIFRNELTMLFVLPDDFR